MCPFLIFSSIFYRILLKGTKNWCSYMSYQYLFNLWLRNALICNEISRKNFSQQAAEARIHRFATGTKKQEEKNRSVYLLILSWSTFTVPLYIKHNLYKMAQFFRWESFTNRQTVREKRTNDVKPHKCPGLLSKSVIFIHHHDTAHSFFSKKG